MPDVVPQHSARSLLTSCCAQVSSVQEYTEWLSSNCRFHACLLCLFGPVCFLVSVQTPDRGPLHAALPSHRRDGQRPGGCCSLLKRDTGSPSLHHPRIMDCVESQEQFSLNASGHQRPPGQTPWRVATALSTTDRYSPRNPQTRVSPLHIGRLLGVALLRTVSKIYQARLVLLRTGAPRPSPLLPGSWRHDEPRTKFGSRNLPQ